MKTERVRETENVRDRQTDRQTELERDRDRQTSRQSGNESICNTFKL